MVAESVIGPECLQLRAAWFSAGCRPPYKGWDAPRLSGLAGSAAATVCLGVALGGCSIPLGPLFEKNKHDDVEMTGSINPMANAMAAMQSDTPGVPETDLAYAREAASEVLAKGGKDTSQTWENPNTGARGAVTPLSSSFTENGFACREFLLSHVQGKSETWLQGDACKFTSGKWEVRSLRSWKRS